MDLEKAFLPSVVAAQLEDVISGSAEQLRMFGRRVGEAVHALLASSSKAFRERVLTADHSDELFRAYTLGQLSFARGFVDQLATRRESLDFRRLIAEPKFVRYIGALCLGDSSNAELAKRIGAAEETVSRKMKELRAHGVVDFRREGRNTINFLTPAAKASFEEHCASTRNALVVNPLVVEVIREELGEMPSHFHRPMTFSSRVSVDTSTAAESAALA